MTADVLREYGYNCLELIMLLNYLTLLLFRQMSGNSGGLHFYIGVLFESHPNILYIRYTDGICCM